jgi:hypothetical protein
MKGEPSSQDTEKITYNIALDIKSLNYWLTQNPGAGSGKEEGAKEGLRDVRLPWATVAHLK